MSKRRSMVSVLCGGYRPVDTAAAHGVRGTFAPFVLQSIDCSKWTPEKVRAFLSRNYPGMTRETLEAAVNAAVEDGIIRGRFTYLPKPPRKTRRQIISTSQEKGASRLAGDSARFMDRFDHLLLFDYSFHDGVVVQTENVYQYTREVRPRKKRRQRPADCQM